MEFLIITGLSGGGKSQAADIIEDLDFYCVDNMPAALIPKFAELCAATKSRYEKVALVADVREKNGFKDILGALAELTKMDFGYKILFMEAEDRAIIKRYKESRRPHPLSKKGASIESAIQSEKELIRPIREMADYVVNTSHLTLGQLRNELYTLFAESDPNRGITVNVMSFGFKYGMPLDADLVFDVRFLPNPYYIEELRLHSGLDEDVRDYIFGFEQTKSFMEKLTDMISFLIPLYIEEGKYSLTIAIGCTGGRHRSVAVATALGEHLRCMVNVMSFGFKYGMPLDADLVFDVRFLPNPYYIEELRLHSGLDEDVRDYIFGFEQTKSFMEKLTDMISFLIPLYIEEGKYSLTIAIGCTGGRHRSVAVATALGEHLRCMDYNAANINRDLNKGG